MYPGTSGGRIDWKAERPGVDLAAVAARLMGEPEGRHGERGRKLWWTCPFHADRNPSLAVDPGSPWWKCYGCDAKGDAATLVMRLESVDFPEAVRRLVGGGELHRITPSPRPAPKPEAPSGLPHADALALVEESEARLWSPEGADALAGLVEGRRLTPDTIRAARLGWTPHAEIPTQRGTAYPVSGVVIPWFDGDRLALVKVRQPGDARPKYAEAFRDRPGVYPGGPIPHGLPLAVVEGEFDALLLGQELSGLAAVATLGSASGRPAPAHLAPLVGLAPWFIATDADDAGDRAAEAWPPGRSRRVRPPSPFKDWTEAAKGWPDYGGVNLRRWWSDRIAGAESPELFTWSDLSSWRWGDDPGPGIVVDAPDRARMRDAVDLLPDGPGDANEL